MINPGGLRFEPCPALLVAVEVIAECSERMDAPQLNNFPVYQFLHYVHILGHPLPEVLQSPAANLGFTCGGDTPESDDVDDYPITLQVNFSVDDGYKLSLFLRDVCCPDPEERRKLIESGALRYLRPRRPVSDFIEGERCSMLVTESLDEDGFRAAVVEAVDTFIRPN